MKIFTYVKILITLGLLAFAAFSGNFLDVFSKVFR